MIKKPDIYALGALTAMTALLVLLVSPVFEVALDDSWNFALPTMHFLETGVPQFDPYNSAAAVLHILWGGLFALIFGFSFSVCRIANIVLALLTSYILYFTFRQTGANEKVSFAGAATFAANPVFMVTSYTYQSDIAYLACAFGAIAFYLRYLKSLRHKDLILATVIASLSIWNKVHGLLIPIGALVFFIWQAKPARIRGVRWVTISAIPFLSLMLFAAAKPIVHPISTTLDTKSAEFFDRVFSFGVWSTDGVWRLFFIVVALGIYALPLLSGWFFVRTERPELKAKTRAAIAGCWSILMIFGFYLFTQDNASTYPFHSSVFRESPPMPETAMHFLLTFLAWPAGALLGYHLTCALVPAIKKGGAPLLLFILLAPQILILVPILLFMDRYFLVLIPMVLLLLTLRQSRTRFHLAPAVLLIACFFVFGMLRIDQYKAGNIAQWKGAGVLTSQGISNLEIDAGYSWTGWNNYEHALAHPNVINSKPGDHWYIHELNRSTNVLYQVTFWPPPDGVTPIKTIPYKPRFSNTSAEVHVWKESPAQ